MFFVALEHGAEDEWVPDFFLAHGGADGCEECVGVYSLLADICLDVLAGEMEEMERYRRAVHRGAARHRPVVK